MSVKDGAGGYFDHGRHYPNPSEMDIPVGKMITGASVGGKRTVFSFSSSVPDETLRMIANAINGRPPR